MKTRLTVLAAVLAAALPALAAPTAVERGIWVQAGQKFQKVIVLDTHALAGGQRLEKGSYDVRFESLAGNKARATFFQGGVRKGEAVGIIIINSQPQASLKQAGQVGDPHAPAALSSLGLGSTSPHTLRKQGDKLDLLVGPPGASHILIGLLLPAVK